MFLPEKNRADHQPRNPNMCLEIFSQVDVSCWKVYTLSVSIQKQTWYMSVHPAASESPAGFVIQLQYQGKGQIQFILGRIIVMTSFRQIIPNVVPGAVESYIAHWLFLFLPCLLDACLQKLIRVDCVIYSARLQKEKTLQYNLCLECVRAEITAGQLKGASSNNSAIIFTQSRISIP